MKITIILSLILIPIFCFSQNFEEKAKEQCDNLMLKSGEEISASIEEVGEDLIKYRKCNNQSGPLYSISRNKVFMIKYANGTKDLFNDVPENNQETDNLNSNDDCIVYLFAGNQIGSIGGTVSINSGSPIKLTTNTIEKLTIKPSKITFQTNYSKGYYRELIRTFESNKIYFIEFNSIGSVLKHPTLRFVDYQTFLRLYEFKGGFPNGYEYADNGKLNNEVQLKFAISNNCKDCEVEINGTPIIIGPEKKTIYSIGVPNKEIVVSIINREDENSSPSKFSTITLNPKESHFLTIDFKGADGIGEFKLGECSADEFMLDRKNYKTVNINK